MKENKIKKVIALGVLSNFIVANFSLGIVASVPNLEGDDDIEKQIRLAGIDSLSRKLRVDVVNYNLQVGQLNKDRERLEKDVDLFYENVDNFERNMEENEDSEFYNEEYGVGVLDCIKFFEELIDKIKVNNEEKRGVQGLVKIFEKYKLDDIMEGYSKICRVFHNLRNHCNDCLIEEANKIDKREKEIKERSKKLDEEARKIERYRNELGKMQLELYRQMETENQKKMDDKIEKNDLQKELSEARDEIYKEVEAEKNQEEEKQEKIDKSIEENFEKVAENFGNEAKENFEKRAREE